MEKFQKFLDVCDDHLAVSIVPIAVVAIVVFGWIVWEYLTWDQAIELLRITIWPMVLFCALLFFKKVSTYLFFSMEEFNFFGTKGKLKDVREVIKEKAQEMHDRDRAEGESRERESRLTRQVDFHKRIAERKDSTWEAKYKSLDDVFTELYGDFKELSKKYRQELEQQIIKQNHITSLQGQVDALLEQIQKMQAREGVRENT